MVVPVTAVQLARGTGAWFTGRPRAAAVVPGVGSAGEPVLGEMGNLAHTRPHRPAALAAARADACRQMSLDPERVVMMRQVHGGDVAIVDESVVEGAEVRGVDALVTQQVDRPLVVQVADCVPVLAAADDGPVGVAHAGRRGVVAGVVEAMVDALERLGAPAESLHVAIGPSIGGCCYEVGDELAESVSASHPAARATTTWGTASLDLPAAVAAILQRRGVGDLRPWAGCTRCDPGQRWFSHRADPATGRQWGVVVRRSARAAHDVRSAA